MLLTFIIIPVSSSLCRLQRMVSSQFGKFLVSRRRQRSRLVWSVPTGERGEEKTRPSVRRRSSTLQFNTRVTV